MPTQTRIPKAQLDSTLLASDTPVTIAEGGTGQATQQAAINALAGTQSAGKYLRSDGTNTSLSTIQAADVPTLNQSTTGNAATATTLQTARNIDGQSFNGSADITVIAPGTHAATSKTTPVDADELPVTDSAASFVLKKLTWANLKAALKTYFDTLYQAAGTYLTPSSTNTLTNKRITKRSGTVSAPGATPSLNTDNYDIYTFTGLAVAITSMTTNLTGTPNTGDEIILGFKDNGTARAIAWGASFKSSGVATLLATTVINKQHWLKLMWDGSAWVCMAVDATGY